MTVESRETADTCASGVRASCSRIPPNPGSSSTYASRPNGRWQYRAMAADASAIRLSAQALSPAGSVPRSSANLALVVSRTLAAIVDTVRDMHLLRLGFLPRRPGGVAVLLLVVGDDLPVQDQRAGLVRGEPLHALVRYAVELG